jgi:hypothetical protein
VKEYSFVVIVEIGCPWDIIDAEYTTFWDVLFRMRISNFSWVINQKKDNNVSKLFDHSISQFSKTKRAYHSQSLWIVVRVS